jgi:hypothetical protein
VPKTPKQPHVGQQTRLTNVEYYSNIGTLIKSLEAGQLTPAAFVKQVNFIGSIAPVGLTPVRFSEKQALEFVSTRPTHLFVDTSSEESSEW